MKQNKKEVPIDVLSIKEIDNLSNKGIDTSDGSMFWIINTTDSRADKKELIPPYISATNHTPMVVGFMHFDIKPTYTFTDLFNKLPYIRDGYVQYVPVYYKGDDGYVIDYHQSFDFNDTFRPDGVDFTCVGKTPLRAAYEMMLKVLKLKDYEKVVI